MFRNLQSRTLSVLGSILMICSLLAIFEIGWKVKNLFIVGVLAGIIAWGLALFISRQKIPVWSSMAFSLASSIIFGSRLLANLRGLVGIVQHAPNYDAYNKCTLIVLLMIMTFSSIVSLMMSYTFQGFESTKE